MLATWLPKIASGLSWVGKGVFGIAGAAAAGWMAGRVIDTTLKAMGMDISKLLYNSRKDNFRTGMIDAGAGTITRDQMIQRVAAMAASNQSADVIRAYVLKNIDNIKGMNDSIGGRGSTKEFRESAVRGIMEGLGQVLNREAARVISTTLTDQTDRDKSRVERAYRTNEEIAKNSAFTNVLLQKVEKNRAFVDEKRAMLEEARDTEDRLRRQSAAAQRTGAAGAYGGMGGMMPVW